MDLTEDKSELTTNLISFIQQRNTNTHNSETSVKWTSHIFEQFCIIRLRKLKMFHWDLLVCICFGIYHQLSYWFYVVSLIHRGCWFRIYNMRFKFFRWFILHALFGVERYIFHYTCPLQRGFKKLV